MIHLVRAAERRMAVLGGGRILLVAGGTPRDPAVGAITVGAVAEFVRATAPRFAAQGVTINGIVAILPVSAPTGPEEATRPTARTDAGPVPEDTVVGGLGESVTESASDHPMSALPAPAAGSIARSDDVLDQAPVIPVPVPTEGPRLVPADPTPPAGSASVQPHDYAAPTVATAILFLGPANAALTGQVVRVGG